MQPSGNGLLIDDDAGKTKRVLELCEDLDHRRRRPTGENDREVFTLIRKDCSGHW